MVLMAEPVGALHLAVAALNLLAVPLHYTTIAGYHCLAH
jgi:hypothetical protein